jgi:hypothetical protein
MPVEVVSVHDVAVRVALCGVDQEDQRPTHDSNLRKYFNRLNRFQTGRLLRLFERVADRAGDAQVTRRFFPISANSMTALWRARLESWLGSGNRSMT